MDRDSYYLALPHDLSGSMSKNRFRMELLWGVSKMLELMETPMEFSVVFDYACDIEVHSEQSFEFYQIKTHKNNSSYTTANLTRIKGEASILGRLYMLKTNESNMAVKLAIVSNVPYKGLPNDSLISPLISLSAEEKSKIERALKQELSIENIDLDNILYIHTTMNFEDPENEIRGKLVVTFEKIKNCEPLNPNALYRLVLGTVQEKACYEFTCNDYEEVISRKGITRAEFDELLNTHLDAAKTGVQAVNRYIDSLDNLGHRRVYKKALAQILPIISTSKQLREIEKEIAGYLLSTEEFGTTEETADLLMEMFHDHFPIEIEKTEMMVFFLLIIFKFEEGAYDECDI